MAAFIPCKYAHVSIVTYAGKENLLLSRGVGRSRATYSVARRKIFFSRKYEYNTTSKCAAKNLVFSRGVGLVSGLGRECGS